MPVDATCIHNGPLFHLRIICVSVTCIQSCYNYTVGATCTFGLYYSDVYAYVLAVIFTCTVYMYFKNYVFDCNQDKLFVVQLL